MCWLSGYTPFLLATLGFNCVEGLSLRGRLPGGWSCSSHLTGMRPGLDGVDDGWKSRRMKRASYTEDSLQLPYQPQMTCLQTLCTGAKIKSLTFLSVRHCLCGIQYLGLNSPWYTGLDITSAKARECEIPALNQWKLLGCVPLKPLMSTVSPHCKSRGHLEQSDHKGV